MPHDIMQVRAAKAEIARRLVPVHDEIQRIADLRDPTDGDLERQDRQLRAAEKLNTELEIVRGREMDLLVGLVEKGYTEPGDQRPLGYQEPGIRRTHGGTERGRAYDMIERSANEFRLEAEDADRLTVSIERAEATDPLAQHILRTGSEEYRSAFLKLVRDPANGHRLFTGPELDAFQDVEIFRAMSLGTNSAGGYLVPFDLDPQIRLSSAGVVDPMRQLATIKQTVVNEQRVVTSSSVVASWDAEQAEVSDDTPTLAQPSITSFKGAAFLPVSYELFEDSALAQEVAGLMADAKANLEAPAFITGTGSGQPEGVITGVVAAAIAGQLLTSAGSALSVADAQAVQNAVPPRFRAANPAWLAHLAIINQGVVLPKYTNGPALVDDSGTPRRMLNWDLYEASSMDGTIAAGATADYVLLAGSFSKGYMITDRIGTTIELVPHLFGASQRPTGQRGFYLHFRTGAKVIVPAAFALMNYSG
jgi:HK97 family phage major capsid protein